MRTGLLVMLASTPAAALGYLLLLAYLVNRIRPLPIAIPPADGLHPGR